MGICLAREKSDVTLPNATPEEQFVYKSETSLGLYKVDYESFMGAVKRYGYKSDLNADHMNAIAAEINLNYKDLIEHENSIYSVVYKDPNFIFKDNRHNA